MTEPAIAICILMAYFLAMITLAAIVAVGAIITVGYVYDRWFK